jgi:hypothetical protein
MRASHRCRCNGRRRCAFGDAAVTRITYVTHREVHRPWRGLCSGSGTDSALVGCASDLQRITIPLQSSSQVAPALACTAGETCGGRGWVCPRERLPIVVCDRLALPSWTATDLQRLQSVSHPRCRHPRRRRRSCRVETGGGLPRRLEPRQTHEDGVAHADAPPSTPRTGPIVVAYQSRSAAVRSELAVRSALASQTLASAK